MQLIDEPKLNQEIDFKLNHIPVMFYDESLEKDLFDSCCQSKHVGLTHIRPDSDRNILICLTTRSMIYVLDTEHSSHVEMLKRILTSDLRVKFYTTRGQFILFRLAVQLGIKPDENSIIDLPAYDIFLSMRKCCLNGYFSGKSYTMLKLKENKDMIRYHDRTDLTKIYLGVSLPERDKKRERQETELIREKPESDEAKDVIRKRSCLVNDLGIKIEEQFEAMTFQDVNNLYSFAHKVNGKRYIEYENLDDDSYTTVIEYLKRQGCNDD